MLLYEIGNDDTGTWVRRAGVRRSQVPQVCQGTRQDGGLGEEGLVAGGEGK